MTEPGRPAPEDRLDPALDLVLDQPPELRTGFIAERFADDPDLRDELLELLRGSDAVSDLLSQVDRAAALLFSTSGGTDDETDEPVALPDSIGAYTIVDRLGAGGMGTVYLAERSDGEVQRRVALKVVTAAPHRPDIHRRFMAEQRILARLEHPNIARLYDAGIDDTGAPYFVMEYVDGVPIDRYSDDQRLTVDQRLALVRNVTDALAYAHRSLVVHRDVKPSNILVTRDGSVRLLDFGVAKLLDDGPVGDPLTRPGSQLLTPEYASPEQIRGEAVTTAADVYATGVLLYELLTGARPYEFETRSPIHIERVVSGRDPRPPSTVATGIGEAEAARRATTPARLSRTLAGDLDAILLTALRKDPRDRYGSIQELASDIDRYRTREPVRARAPTWRYRAGRFVVRHRAPVAAVALILAALGAGLFATVRQARIATREAERAERVKELLVGLFEGADPDVAAGAELTAVELLARGEENLLAGLEGEPEIRAELLETLGAIYTALGEYARAGPLLQSAVDLRDRSSGADEQATVLSTLADLLHATGDHEEGERIARRVLELRRSTHPELSTEFSTALTNLASFVQNQGRLDEAETLLRRGLEIDREVGTPELVAVDLNNLGTLLASQGRYDEAIPVLEESVDLRRESYPTDHTQVATGMANLAWALHQKGEYDRAEPLYDSTLAMRRRLLGHDHPLVATVLDNKASMRQAQRRFAESRDLHSEALGIRRAAFGPDHVQVAGSLNNLGVVSYFENDHQGAEDAFEEALRVFRLHLSEDHPSVMTAVSNLGAVLRAQGKLAAAETLLRSTLETRIQVLGPDHHQTGGSWNNLGGLLREQGRYDESEEATRRAVEIFRRVLSPGHPDLADALLGMGRTLVTRGRGGEWVDELEESCGIMTERFGPDDLAVAQCRAVLGLAFLDAGEEDRARAELSATVETLEAARPDDPWTLRSRDALRVLSGS